MNPPKYSLAERDRRWELARTFMTEQRVDALIVFGEHEDSGPAPYNFDNWFTNARPGAVVVFPRNSLPFMLTMLPSSIPDHWLAVERGETPWIAAQNLRVGRDPTTVTTLLSEHGLTEGRIGVLGLEPFIPVHVDGIMPFNLWTNILTALPKASFKSVGREFGEMIMALGDEETAVLRHAASVGDSMAQAMIQVTRPGALESDVVKAGMAAAFERGSSAPLIHIGSGPNAINWGPPAWSFSPQSGPRMLQAGDVVSSEIFGTYGMRSSQQQVTIAIGEVHEDVERAALVARASYEAGLEALRPGVRFGDVAEAMLVPLREAGAWSKGPQIHSLNPILAICSCDVDFGQIGVSNKYRREWTLPTLADDLILKPGMSFAFEPSSFFGSRGVCIGSTVILGQDGPIELNPDLAYLLRVEV
jgi:Xaa-Pro aminopeptidase